MKRIFTIALFTMLLSMLSAQAQTLTLKVSDRPLHEVLPLVAQQCDYHFFYNSNLPGLDSRVTVNLTNTPLEQALQSPVPLSYACCAEAIHVRISYRHRLSWHFW